MPLIGGVDMKSMVEVLFCHVQAQPDKLFVADDMGHEYSYEAFWSKVRHVACNLINMFDIKPGDKIMAECNQDAAFLIVDFACELIHAVFVPIEKDASRDRKCTISEETESVLWIYKRDTQPDFIRNVTYDELFTDNGILEKYSFPSENDIAEILYTTGTTGTSKGISISHKANVAVADNVMHGVHMKPLNVEMIPLPISHSHGIRCCYANLLNGSSIILTDGLMIVKNIFKLIDKYNVTAMDLSPSAVSLLIKISKGRFWEYGKKLDYIQIGTASLVESLKQQLVNELPGVHLYNFYGSTESGRSCVLDFSVDCGRLNCIGKPTQNSHIIFTDENRMEIKATIQNPGLLASKGDMNMTGYWKQPDLTQEIMRDGYVYTNDLGYMDKDGYIYVLGRNDDVINYNGIKIAPTEIEEAAVNYNGVSDAGCVPQSNPLVGQVPMLFIAVESEELFNMQDFMSYLGEHLDGNKMPKRVEILNEIPRTYNGKIQRKKLMELV